MAGVIINEFLTFVQNKIDVLDELSIVQICATNFTDSEVESGKSALYNACGDGVRNIQRKGEDRKKKNMKEFDPDAQPTFVARDLSRLPPVSFDHVHPTNITLATFNCRSVKRSAEQIKELSENVDILALQETWLPPHDLGFVNGLSQHFSCFAKSAVDTSTGILKGRPYGGLPLMWRKSLFPSVSIIDCTSDKLAAVQIDLGGRHILVMTVYLPFDDGYEDCLADFIACLGNIVAVISDIEAIYVLGDFNAHFGTRFDELNIVQICATNFTDSEVESGKSALYNGCGDGVRNIQRKGEDRKKKNMKEVDPDAQPTFVARDLSRLPPVSFDHVHVTRLLKDMSLMKAEMTDFKTKFSHELANLRISLDSHKERGVNIPPIMTTPEKAKYLTSPNHNKEDSRQAKRTCTRNTSSCVIGVAADCTLVSDAATKSNESPANDTSFKIVEYKKRKSKIANMRGTSVAQCY
ncbi:unnamed protein product [Leptidea sinapis]|uniref:Endonuclease/exonuclease/phosphatase domain-containing protein n=1 Tax=Leptidea sinapis TaxID=189913 RepID=A0A5E4QKY6_9NEOP|nr:unnamed protein product [Leptidea sinapis]